MGGCLVTAYRPRGGLKVGDETLNRVAWTRGDGCLPLAEVLGGGVAIAITGEPEESCLTNRVDLLVARRMTSFDLVPVAVPVATTLTNVTEVTAAVAGGPHSELAAAVAARIAAALGVDGALATVHRGDRDRAPSLERLGELAGHHPQLDRTVIESQSVAGLIEVLSPTTLLILGAPGGSWLHRQFFGVGHRLQVAAPGGVIVVRSAPRRCFHRTVDAAGVAVGPHLSAAAARDVVRYEVVPVADAGQLVGVVRLSALREADGHLSVADVMEPPVAVEATEPLTAADDLKDFLDGGPVPVTDRRGRLIGTIPADTAASGG